MSKVVFADKKIFIDGVHTQIVSGAIHYFRVHPELWEDRLTKMAQCGLNCVETYMCWNLHEPQEGQFDFNGMLDFERFIKLVQKLGMYCIVRPGPYICAEWDNGGFPYWLMTKPNIEMRRMNKPYIDAVENYYNVIIPKLAALQYDNNGPIIAMQVENEYGSYCHDKDYLNAIRDMMVNNGVTVPLFTSDGPTDEMLSGGIIDGVSATVNLGSRALKAFDLLAQKRPNDPPFVMEFWNGWFDYWGVKTHAENALPVDRVACEVDDILRVGGNINFYMFHGGTNFGFYAGANRNFGSKYTPDTTSYDYDAPLTEAGDPTPKYFAYQNIIKKYLPNAKIETPKASEKRIYTKVFFSESAPLLGQLDNIGGYQKSLSPKSMEELGQDFGFVHYRTTIKGAMRVEFKLIDINDRAQLFVNGKPFFTSYRDGDTGYITPKLDIPEEGVTLDLLVENLGRVNYGYLTGKDFKGISGAFLMGGMSRLNWDMWTLPMNNLENLTYGDFDCQSEVPTFHRGTFEIADKPCDTFLRFPGECGVVWINGFNLGRYWSIGTGKTLYVPAPILKQGKNEIVVFETTNISFPYAEFTDTPIL